MDGRVATFDGAAGIGTVRGDDGREWFFHCTQIADGSRAIDEDTAVTFKVRPGQLGRWEAYAISPRPAPGAVAG